MDEAARLVKVLRAGNIRRNDAIVPPSFINAVDLDHEQDWNPAVFQFAGQLVGRGSSPAMSEKDDAGLLPFLA